MKKLATILTIALLNLSYTSFGQETPSKEIEKKASIGIKAGLNIATMTKDNTASPLPSYIAGIDWKYRLNKRSALSAELLISGQGTKIDDPDKTIKVKTTYINIPILYNLYITDNFALKIGAQLGVLLNNTLASETATASTYYDMGDSFNAVDFGIPLGISYDFPYGLNIDARYVLGVTNILNNDSYDSIFHSKKVSSMNSVFSITLGWKVML